MHWRMALMAAAIATWSGAACAAEITVLSGGAVEAGLKPAIAAFEKETGHRVAVTFNTAPQIKTGLRAGKQSIW